MERTLKAPRQLRPATRRWWLSVVQEWDLEDHHIRLLTLAAEAWDRTAQARALIEKDGLVTGTVKGGLRAHPAVGIERDSRLAFARLIRELDLDLDAPADQRRPPSLRSIAGGRG